MGDGTSEFYSERRELKGQLCGKDRLAEQLNTVSPVFDKPTLSAGLVDAHLVACDIVKRVREIEQCITGDSPNAESAFPGDSSLDAALRFTLVRLSEAIESLERIRMAIVGNEKGERLY